jgi:mitochondrial fusion and transport protein UGO1
MEDATRPEYIIPVGSAAGVWGMIKRLGRFRGEGWLALWKGNGYHHDNKCDFSCSC